MITVETCQDALYALLNSHPYQQALGAVFIMALVIGALLDEGGKTLVNWLLAAMFLVIGLEFSRYVFWSSVGAEKTGLQGIAVTLIGMLVYMVGLATGWVIAQLAKNRAHKNMIRNLNILDEQQEEIKDGTVD